MTTKQLYAREIDAAIAHARFSGSRATVDAEDGAQACAYPHKDGIAWGVNGPEGVNILRGIRRPDDTDIALSE